MTTLGTGTAAKAAVPARLLPGGLMRLVAEGLKARGFGVLLPEREDEFRLSVERWGGRCDLSVSDFGFVEWDCVPWAGPEPAPELIADIAAFLLTGEAGDHPSVRNVHRLPGMPFKGVVGHVLKERGLDVSLEVYADDNLFDVWADILVKNPVARDHEVIRVTDDGSISWEREYPYEVTEITGPQKYLEVPANYRELADSIVTTVAGAVSLSSGRDGNG